MMRTIEAETINEAALITREQPAPVATAGTYERMWALQQTDEADAGGNAVPDELYPYFQDIYDHVLRVSESTDSLRDLVSTIVETNISLRDYRQNLVMKKVSSVAWVARMPTCGNSWTGHPRSWPKASRMRRLIWQQPKRRRRYFARAGRMPTPKRGGR